MACSACRTVCTPKPVETLRPFGSSLMVSSARLSPALRPSRALLPLFLRIWCMVHVAYCMHFALSAYATHSLTQFAPSGNGERTSCFPLQEPRSSPTTHPALIGPRGEQTRKTKATREEQRRAAVDGGAFSMYNTIFTANATALGILTPRSSNRQSSTASCIWRHVCKLRYPVRWSPSL